jgi:HSP20 family protein
MSTSVQKDKHFVPSIWDRWFSDFFNESSMPSDFSNNMPAVNVKAHKNGWELEAALPGMKKEDINISVENGVLSISAENRSEQHKKEENYTRREFSYQSFNRSFRLPENADEDDITAVYTDGVLRVSLKKNDPLQPSYEKTITID